MNLQDAFYVIGIIYMGVTLVLYFVIIVALFALKKKIDEITSTVEEKIDTVKQFAFDPTRTAMMLFSSVAGKALGKVSMILRR